MDGKVRVVFTEEERQTVTQRLGKERSMVIVIW